MVQALSLEELTHRAEVIVLGVATEQQSRYGIDGKLIVTDVSMKVETALKGDVKSGETLIATVLGGRIDDVALQVPGEANLPIGQRVIAFLYRSPQAATCAWSAWRRACSRWFRRTDARWCCRVVPARR